MKKLIILALIVVLTTVVCGIGQAAIVGTTEVKLSDGTTYNVSSGGIYYVEYYGIDLDYDATGPQIVNLHFGDNSVGSGWEKFHFQIHEDHFGGDGHLLQAYDKWWSSLDSSHGFNAGSVTGPFDIRMCLQQNPDSTWALTPMYRVPTGSGDPLDGSINGLDVWHTFFDGAYTSTEAFDLTVLEVFAQVDPSSSGEVEIQGVYVTPIPGAVWLFGSGLIGLLGLKRRFMKS